MSKLVTAAMLILATAGAAANAGGSIKFNYAGLSAWSPG